MQSISATENVDFQKLRERFTKLHLENLALSPKSEGSRKVNVSTIFIAE